MDIYTEYKDYWIHNDIFIIRQHFNEYIQTKFIDDKYNKLIFTNYLKFYASIEKYYSDQNDTIFDYFKYKMLYTYSIFNKPIDNLPQHIILIIFGYSFNHPVDNLPNKLIHLEFGNWFNHSVDNLPNSLIYLEFGHWFNHSVNNLPNSLTCLKFKYNYIHPIDNLPNSLVLLEIGNNYGNSLKNLLLSCKILKH